MVPGSRQEHSDGAGEIKTLHLYQQLSTPRHTGEKVNTTGTAG
jgi:hypothetical protein